MGAHHFKFHLIPAGARLALDENGDPAGNLLINHPISATALVKLRALLPRPNHWGRVEEFNSPGDWGSDIRIYREEDGRVSDIAIRYAPGCDSLDVLRAFVEVSKEAGCDLAIDSTREVVPSDFGTVVSELRKHRAFRFLSDPENAIKEAARETEKKANKAPEPTSTSVTPRATSRFSDLKQRTEIRIEARGAPAVAVAHL